MRRDVAAIPRADGPGTAPATGPGRRCEYARWFILMRWIAVSVATVTVTVAVGVAEMLPAPLARPLGATIAVLAALNIVYTILARHGRGLNWLLPTQIYIDLVLLTLLLHFSGGIENLLSLLMVFHVIIGGIILSRRQCYAVAAVASLLYAGLAWGEWSGVLAHYTLSVFPHYHSHEGSVHAAHLGRYVLSAVSLQCAIFFLTAYFVSTLAERLRTEERQTLAFAEEAQRQRRLVERALQQEQQTQAQMIQAGKLAAVGELAGQVAHEVNNPIAVISAKARLLLDDHRAEMSPRTVGEVEKIRDLADRVARIARGLLSSCRPSIGVRQPLDPCGPVRNALDLIGPRSAAGGVQVNDSLGESLPPVLGNAGELEQVFFNLCINALDAMPAGGRLTVEGDRDGDRVRVRVTDTGAGIAPAAREKIFQPFFSTKAPGRGTGLGLSICLGLVRSHGGDIAVESEPGQGSCFTVTLPVWKESAEGSRQ